MLHSTVPGSVSKWLVSAKDGVLPSGLNQASRTDAKSKSFADYGANLLWRRFGAKLVRIARAQLRGVADQCHDAEDVALTTIHKVCDRVLDGEYANLSNRKELWYLLLTVSRNKSRDCRRRANRRAAREASVSNQADFIRLVELVDQRTASAEWLAIMDEQCEMLLRKLDEQDPTGVLRKIALMRLDGESKSRIAKKFGHTRRTVVARLTLIQAIWNSYLDNHDD